MPVQATGEALYTNDMPQGKESLFAAFVASTEALAVIKGVDASAALALPGVIAYFGAEDVPGVNKAATGDAELLFATDKVGRYLCIFGDFRIIWAVLIIGTHLEVLGSLEIPGSMEILGSML